jgi:capsular polysaccharide biosynthesis protein
VLVTVHGSGSNNALFMGEGGTLLEVRPFRFGTEAWTWAAAFMPQVRTRVLSTLASSPFVM